MKAIQPVCVDKLTVRNDEDKINKFTHFFGAEATFTSFNTPEPLPYKTPEFKLLSFSPSDTVT